MAFQPKEDLTCPVCQDIYKDPVLLMCSHSLCTFCLRSWWREKPTKECPVCKTRCSSSELPLNLALRNLCEAYLQQQKEEEERKKKDPVCQLHSEPFKLFCMTDRQPVCVVCRDSNAHREHNVRPINEATTQCKEELRMVLTPLKERLEHVERFRKYCELSVHHIKTQYYHTANLIEKEFLKLHNFLSQQQKTRMKALKEEEERKTQRMEEKMVSVSREIEALSEIISATEEQLRVADDSFLVKYKAAVERVQRCPLLEEVQLSPGALIDQAKHLGNLTFNIWSSMKTMVNYSPVVLDPNTAHPALVLSDDLTSLTLGEAQKLPLNPERVSIGLPEIVRGYVGFDSGSHTWDVNVGDSSYWQLGVATLSYLSIAPADKHYPHDAGYWVIKFSKDKHIASTSDNEKDMVFKPRSNLQRIRLHLDCHRHKLTFYDGDTNAHIHSFTHLYKQKMFPIFGSDMLVFILPQKI